MTTSKFQEQKIARLVAEHATNEDHLGLLRILAGGGKVAGDESNPNSWMTAVDLALYEIALSGHNEPPSASFAAVALGWAATAGCPKCVSSLIAAHGPSADCLRALSKASLRGNTECVKLLISSLDSSAGRSALLQSQDDGNPDRATLFFCDSEHQPREQDPLRLAAHNGHVECVKLLLPVSRPLSTHPAPFHVAIEQGHAAIVALMVEREPDLVDAVEAWWIAMDASQKGRADIAFILRSATEKRSLSNATQKPILAEPAATKRL